jgi:two-component sensor histidine kinase
MNNKNRLKLSHKIKIGDHIEPDKPVWKVLIVDDDREVHRLTSLVLKDFTFDEGYLEFISAYSSQEAKEAFQENPDIAIILLDIVMESNTAGLDFVDYVRNVLKDNTVRIIIRTGHPGEAPEKEVFDRYIINDYKDKNELTSIKLYTSIKAALRNYIDLITINEAKQEKDLLIKEIHHRVKNNLQVIISMLRLQMNKYNYDSHTYQILMDFENRIRSVYLIYNMLLEESSQFIEINIKTYINNLIKHIFRAYNIDKSRIRLDIDINDIYLGLDEAIPCAQIISELVTNIIKYALKPQDITVINIQFFQDENGVKSFIIKDNGKGFPEEFDFDNVQTLGLDLVKLLVDQLEGDIEFSQTDGTKFSISF